MWDIESYKQFYDYYEKESLSKERIAHFERVCSLVLKMIGSENPGGASLRIADIGCGAGTQSLVWAKHGHSVFGLDLNKPLVELAKKRSLENGYDIKLILGSATNIPLHDGAIDVCLVEDLLEHVENWKSCLDEFRRILKPGGTLFLTTTNKLCPRQEEFNLPLYSWYPAFLKRYFLKLVLTNRPGIANYAKYPAFNWFCFYGLRRALSSRGFFCLDRFSLIDISGKNKFLKGMLFLIKKVFIFNFLAHMVTPYTQILGIKNK